MEKGEGARWDSSKALSLIHKSALTDKLAWV